MKYLILSVVLLSVAFMDVGGRNAELPLPSVPSDLRRPSERAAYVMQHFWDEMDWSDALLTDDVEFMEQNSSNFYSLFSLTDSVSASEAVRRMLDGASADKKAYDKVAEIARLYLYEPYSPVADDEAYLVVIDRLIMDKKLDDAELLRLEDMHQTLMRNRVRHQAVDFEFIDREGRKGSLSEEAVKNKYTLLMFYDPDCHDCAELERHLSASSLLDGKGVGILMASPYGEQDGLWLEHARTMPAEWTVARTASDDFESDELYDIRVTPTVYLLDRSGKVVAKNLNINTIDDILTKL